MSISYGIGYNLMLQSDGTWLGRVSLTSTDPAQSVSTEMVAPTRGFLFSSITAWLEEQISRLAERHTNRA